VLYYPSDREGLAWLESLAGDQPANPGWYVGTDEYEQNRRIADAWVRDVLEAMKAERGDNTP